VSIYSTYGRSYDRSADYLSVDVQRALKRRGYYSGAIDGDIGPGSRAAIRRYQAQNPELAERFALFDLFAPKIPRIAINKVRFAIGYGDSGERPLPDLGTPLDNPLNPESARRSPISPASSTRSSP
jgi:hypothetical protein